MSINFLRHQGYPLAMKRRFNVAKFEAMTGRLIWWRNYPQVGSTGRLNATALPLYGGVQAAEIAPLHGTDDVVIWIDEGTGHSTSFGTAKGTLLRVRECGGQELDCIPWRIDLPNVPYSGGPLFPGDGYANQSQTICGTTDGRINIGGTNGTRGDNYGGGFENNSRPVPWTRAYDSAGATSYGYGYGPPLAAVPGTNRFYARHGTITDTSFFDPDLIHSSGQLLVLLAGGSVLGGRAIVPGERLIAAHPNGQAMTSLRLGTPILNDASAVGTLTRTTGGGLVAIPGTAPTLYGYYYTVISPTQAQLVDPSVVAMDTGIIWGGAVRDGNPRALLPECACGYGSRWYMTGPEADGGASSGSANTFVCCDLSLSVIWRKDNVGSFRRMLADDSGIYCVCRGATGHDINGSLMSLIKYDHNGNVIYGLNTAVGNDACLSPDGKYLYVCG